MFAASYTATLRLLKDRDQVVVRALDDELVERLGHRPGDGYTFEYWLPLLGPATFALGCRLAAGLSPAEAYPVTVTAMAECVGLRNNKGRALVKRSLARLVGFELAAASMQQDTVVLSLRRAWAPLTLRQLGWLPGWLAEDHRHEHRPDSPVDFEATPSEPTRLGA